MAENYRYEDSYSGRDYIRDGQQEYDDEEEVSDEELTRRAQRCLQVTNLSHHFSLYASFLSVCLMVSLLSLVL